MSPLYQLDFAVLQQITDWYVIVVSTLFIGLLVVDYFASFIDPSKQSTKKTGGRDFL